MENSRRICIAALIRRKEELKHQPSREVVHILISQLENKQLEEQIFKLKMEAEKKNQHISYIKEPAMHSESAIETSEWHNIKESNPAWQSQQEGIKTETKTSTYHSERQKQQENSRNKKGKPNPKTEESAQKVVRQGKEPKDPIESNKENPPNTVTMKECITSLFNHPKEHSGSCSTILKQLMEANITEKRIAPKFIVVPNSGVPILISNTSIETTQTTKCKNKGVYNETLDKLLDKEELVYRLMAHLNQVTNL